MRVEVGGGGLPVPAVAMIVEMGRPGGVLSEKPDGNVLLGYEEQVKSISPMPSPSMSVVFETGSSLTVMLELVAVKGPTVAGVDGTSSATPEGGTGSGRGMSNAIDPVESDDGVAPVASMVVDSVPVREVSPVASASCTTAAGSCSCTWRPVTLNC